MYMRIVVRAAEMVPTTTMYVGLTGPEYPLHRILDRPEQESTLMVWALEVNMVYSPYRSLELTALPNTRPNVGDAAMCTTAAQEYPKVPGLWAATLDTLKYDPSEIRMADALYRALL